MRLAVTAVTIFVFYLRARRSKGAPDRPELPSTAPTLGRSRRPAPGARPPMDLAQMDKDYRIGRSLSDLLDTIQHLEACGVDLYLDQQPVDTTKPWGSSFSS